MDADNGGRADALTNGAVESRPDQERYWAAEIDGLAIQLAASLNYERGALKGFLYKACDSPADGSAIFRKYTPPRGLDADALEAVIERALDAALTPAIGERADSVRARKVEWLWGGMIPLAKLSVFSGDPGEGKSTLTLDLAARVTTGRAFVDGFVAPRGGVVLLAGEDDAADTMVPRLKAAEADLSRVHIIPCAQADGEGRIRLLTLPADVDLVQDAVRKLQARLVIVDPLSSFLSGDVDANSDHDVRRVLAALAHMAATTGAAVLLVRHLNKGAGQKAMYRAGGSIGVVAAARAVYLIGRVPNDESGMRAIVPIKNNLAPLPKPLGFWLKPDESGEAVRAEWSLEKLNVSAADLLGDGQSHKDGLFDVACRFLLDALKDGPRPSREISQRAGERGISERTLKRARAEVGVETFRRGFGADGEWYLRLPGGQSGDAEGEETTN